MIKKLLSFRNNCFFFFVRIVFIWVKGNSYFKISILNYSIVKIGNIYIRYFK